MQPACGMELSPISKYTDQCKQPSYLNAPDPSWRDNQPIWAGALKGLSFTLHNLMADFSIRQQRRHMNTPSVENLNLTAHRALS